MIESSFLWIVLAVSPVDRQDWLLENILASGNRRTALAVGPIMRGAAVSSTPRAGGSLPPRVMVRFEYVGTDALTVRGAVTGISYRFDFPGARRHADLRDAPGLASVATLRRL